MIVNTPYENKNTLIVVDVQPVSHRFHKSSNNELTQYLNAFKGRVLYFFNGEDMSEDTEDDVIDYLLAHGLHENTLKRITFVEKYYGFFRPWMDYGAEDDSIITVGRYMIANNINDSRSIDDRTMKDMLGDDRDAWVLFQDDEPISIPDFKVNGSYYSPTEILKPFAGSEIAGGGENECLKEITLLMKILDLKYNILNTLIY